MISVAVSLLFLILAAPVTPSDLVVPNFPDLTVKTRTDTADHHTLETTWYFKGARQRLEIRNPDDAKWMGHPSLCQCDKGVRYSLNESSKTYNTVPLDLAEVRKTAHAVPQQEMIGGEITVTIDSVDTGDRRQIGSYLARRVKTTMTVEPGPGALTRPSTTEIDGWYIEVAGRNCHAENPNAMGWSTAWSGGRRDRVLFKRLGTAPHGLAIEETYTKTEAGKTLVNKTRLVEISEQQLDESLFEVPPGYAPAPAPRQQ